MYPSILMSTISRNISSVRSFHIVNCVFTHNHNCATIRFKQRCFSLYPFIPFALELTCRAVTVYYCALSLVIYVLTFHFHGWPFCVTSWKNFTSKQYECNAFVTLPLYTFETWPWINDGHSHSFVLFPPHTFPSSSFIASLSTIMIHATELFMLRSWAWMSILNANRMPAKNRAWNDEARKRIKCKMQHENGNYCFLYTNVGCVAILKCWYHL